MVSAEIAFRAYPKEEAGKHRVDIGSTIGTSMVFTSFSWAEL